MSGRAGPVGAFLLLVVGFAPAGADIYVWSDSPGVDHYTNDLALVPEKYREDVGTVAKDWARSELPAAEPEEPEEGPEVVVVHVRRKDGGDEQSFRPRPEAPLRIESAPQLSGPVVQNIQLVVQENPWPRAPMFFGPVLARGPVFRRKVEKDVRDGRAAFIRGPAGPPPLGAPGPPPVNRSRF